MVTYSSRRILDFLHNMDLNFTMSCWYNDKVHGNPSDRILREDAERWFMNHFPAEKAQFIFRHMQTECTAAWFTGDGVDPEL
jgi:hypothetical protein